MFYSLFQQRLAIVASSMLLMVMSLSLTMFPGTAFAKVKSAQCPQAKLCSFAVTSHTAFASTASAITVQKVWTRDGNGNDKTVFNPGDAIQYAFYVNNSSGSTITATFHFSDYWGTINDGVIQILDQIFQNVALPVGVTGWYTQTTVPTNALPGSYTDRILVWDQNNYPQNQSTNVGSFSVVGTRNLNVPYYSQFEESLRNNECGPTSVIMVLKYYNKGPGGTKGKQIAAIRYDIGQHDGNYSPGGKTVGRELEYPIIDYGASDSEISQVITGNPLPDVQIVRIAAAIQQGQPVIVFLNGGYLPGHKSSYGGHWLVVTGFSSDGTNNKVLVNDPDSTFSGGLPGHPTTVSLSPSLSLSPFGMAIQHGLTLEPNDIAGIIVAS